MNSDMYHPCGVLDAIPQAVRHQYCAIWSEVPDGRLHDNDVFGHLALDISGHSEFCVCYENSRIRMKLDSAELSLVRGMTDGLELPEFYLMERIGYPFFELIHGYVLLHSGGVMSELGAVGILALPGVGKSTLTAALLAADSRLKLVADDVLPLYLSGTQVMAMGASSHIAMRHAMFDGALFVERTCAIGCKNALCMRPERVQAAPVPLRSLVLLRPGKISLCPINDKTEVLRDLLRQQMSLSHAPSAFASAQFSAMMQVISRVPVFEMSLSLLSRRDTEDAVARFLQCREIGLFCHSG